MRKDDHPPTADRAAIRRAILDLSRRDRVRFHSWFVATFDVRGEERPKGYVDGPKSEAEAPR